MSSHSELLAIAAHLHVLLRRKTGRVIDMEWAATNVDYAAEVVRFARAKAQQEQMPELAEWAGRLEAAVPALAARSTAAAVAGSPRGLRPVAEAAKADVSRYVRGLR
jgi:hypothetical protein